MLKRFRYPFVIVHIFFFACSIMSIYNVHKSWFMGLAWLQHTILLFKDVPVRAIRGGPMSKVHIKFIAGLMSCWVALAVRCCFCLLRLVESYCACWIIVCMMLLCGWGSGSQMLRVWATVAEYILCEACAPSVPCYESACLFLMGPGLQMLQVRSYWATVCCSVISR